MVTAVPIVLSFMHNSKLCNGGVNIEQDTAPVQQVARILTTNYSNIKNAGIIDWYQIFRAMYGTTKAMSKGARKF